MLNLFQASAADSLSYHLVYFKDKGSHTYNLSAPQDFLSERSVARRRKFQVAVQQTDFPVQTTYLDKLKAIPGIRVLQSSKWLNAAEILSEGRPGLLDSIRELHFVANIEFLGRLKTTQKPNTEIIDRKYYERAVELKAEKHDSFRHRFDKSVSNRSYMQNQLIGLPALQTLASGMDNFHIAVFDAGFKNAYRIRGMEDLLDSLTIIRDFVDHDNSVWEDDQHGCNVLGFLKTWNPGNYIGSAPFATYTLIRTELAESESPTEEFNWLVAAEFADSIGVDLISASVGYHLFDDPALSHTHAQMDGRTSIIARAANFARERGIMVISSAGNEGNHKWHKIGTPADAPGVVAVGACDEKGFQAGFSSYGPSADHRVKPDFLAPGYRVNVASAFGYYAGNGTSYATPILAGAMAGLMSLFPNKALEEIIEAVRMSATHRYVPDSAYGYGLPDFYLAYLILNSKDSVGLQEDLFYVKEDAVLFQDLNIHFLSASDQTIRIRVKTQNKKKLKTIYRANINIRKGEWYNSDVLMRLAGGSRRTLRKRKVLKSLILIFETENASYHKTFTLS